jgi:hypothetical protein
MGNAKRTLMRANPGSDVEGSRFLFTTDFTDFTDEKR